MRCCVNQTLGVVSIKHEVLCQFNSRCYVNKTWCCVNKTRGVVSIKDKVLCQSNTRCCINQTWSMCCCHEVLCQTWGVVSI